MHLARATDWNREQVHPWYHEFNQRTGAYNVVLNGKQICVDQKYICKTFFCVKPLFTCIWNWTHATHSSEQHNPLMHVLVTWHATSLEPLLLPVLPPEVFDHYPVTGLEVVLWRISWRRQYGFPLRVDSWEGDWKNYTVVQQKVT